jgi:hypothetical protein
MRKLRNTAFALVALAVFCCARCHAQAALLLEQPYGFFGMINPTGHNAIYLQNVCAETPVKLRRCQPGELGVVIARYKGIDKYDWIAVPLVAYLYAVENRDEVLASADGTAVLQIRKSYREAHLESLGDNLSPGNFLHDGWTELLGVAYERRIYVFRFQTTPAQDNAFIAKMNAGPNRSHFDMFFNNCSDFARGSLNNYFPGAFPRSVFPDAGIATPKLVAHELVRYARKHPQLDLTVYKIAQIPGYRRNSGPAMGVNEFITTTPYVISIALLNPYLAGGLAVDYLYLTRGRYRLIPRNPAVLGPDNLFELTAPAAPMQNPLSAGVQAPGAVMAGPAETRTAASVNFGLTESTVTHE